MFSNGLGSILGRPFPDTNSIVSCDKQHIRSVDCDVWMAQEIAFFRHTPNQMFIVNELRCNNNALKYVQLEWFNNIYIKSDGFIHVVDRNRKQTHVSLIKFHKSTSDCMLKLKLIIYVRNHSTFKKPTHSATAWDSDNFHITPLHRLQ